MPTPAPQRSGQTRPRRTASPGKPGPSKSGRAQLGIAHPETSITSITRQDAARRCSPHHAPAETLCHGLASLMQIGPDTAALVCNLRPARTPAIDFENGCDLVLFDALHDIRSARSVVLNRNTEFTHPRTGQRGLLIKQYPNCGFVPRGALRADGSPHPHAGTGFGLALHLSFPLRSAPSPAALYEQSDRYEELEVLQFAYDGQDLRVTGSQSFGHDELLAGVHCDQGGLTSAVPDGDDLLLPVSGHRTSRAFGCGLLRWQRGAGGWRPVRFDPVTGSDGPYVAPQIIDSEPSVIRDVDGSLLFTCRQFGWTTATRQRCHNVPVWRSTDGGLTWAKIMEVADIRAEAPVTVGQAADGTPYIVGNLNTGPLVMKAGWAGREAGTSREILCLWPLNPDRTGLEPHRVVRDSRTDFGPPPAGTSWRVDHPIGTPLRLRDGRWHGVLAYRVLEDAEYTLHAPPTPHTGLYVEEVVSTGEPRPAWRF